MADNYGHRHSLNGDVIRDEKVYDDDRPKFENDDETKGRHRDNRWWNNDRIQMSLYEGGEKKRKKQKKRRRSAKTSPDSFRSETTALTDDDDEDVRKQQLAPSERVQFLLSQDDDTDGTSLESHSIFSEMVELNGCCGQQEWRETARWVKFEEDVEEGGNRWSKPHVATLSLHSLFELRSCFMTGTVIFDMDAVQLAQIIDIMLERMISTKVIADRDVAAKIRDALLRKHKHQYEQHKLDLIKTVRSLADIGRQFSNARNFQSSTDSGVHSTTTITASTANSNLNVDKITRNVPKVLSTPKDFQMSSSSDVVASKGNLHFFKKLPSGAEASNVLIGQLEFLERPISAFVRLRHGVMLGDLTEVPLPTRFLFIIVGPMGQGNRYREIGRAMATIMSDEIFHDVAYKAHERNDLLDGVDEFLDQVTVLPPGEWDPNIRIEPPMSIPPQDKRKQHCQKVNGTIEFAKKIHLADDVDDGGGHGSDPTLKRTGKLFGGLVCDVKRKLPFYASDFKDCLNLQCLAAFMYMYFAMLAPIVTFGGLLDEATGKRMAAIENMLAGAVCGTLYILIAGQPLTMIGSTGPVLVFEKIIYDMCEDKWDYLAFRWWINIWSALILLIVVATDASSLVSYITRFTEENFAVLISFIFIYESFAKTIKTLHSAYTVAFDRVNLSPNPYCVCKPLIGDGEQFGRNETLKDYSFVNENSQKFKWTSNVSSWTYVEPKHNFTQIDWTKIPLSYCTSCDGRLETFSPPDVGQCYKMYDVFLLSILLTLGTFALAYALKMTRNGCYFPSKVREVFSDFAVIIALSLMVLVDYSIGLNTEKLSVPEKFQPTWSGRSWFIHPFNDNPWWTCVVAVPPAILLCILLFMDHQITVVIVNRKENKLKKGCAYHLDLFALCIGVVISGVLGLPIFVAATVMSVSHVNSLRIESECRAPGEKPMFVGVREQRVTGLAVYLFIGISVFMTNVLKYIPMPVLYGVFLYMGVSSLRGVQMIDRICLLFMPMKYQPDYVYLRHVPVKRVHLFTIFQLGCFIVLCLVKEINQTAVIFPIMLVVTVAVRKGMEYVFVDKELKYLDDKMPEITLRKREDAKKKLELALKESQQIKEVVVPIGAVQTEANLHIKLTSGNVMKIPLASITEKVQEPVMNISLELSRSGLWQHIASESSFGSKDAVDLSAKRPKKKKLFDDFEPITINIQRPTPNTSNNNLEKMMKEAHPLLDSSKSPPINDISIV